MDMHPAPPLSKYWGSDETDSKPLCGRVRFFVFVLDVVSRQHLPLIPRKFRHHHWMFPGIHGMLLGRRKTPDAIPERTGGDTIWQHR